MLGNEQVSFSLREKWRRIDHELSPKEERHKKRHLGTLNYVSPPDYDDIATGQLTLNIESGGRRSWCDGKQQRVEKVFVSFVGGVLSCLEAQAERRLETERIEEARRQEAQRAALAQERRQHEESLRRDLLDMVDRWHAAGRTSDPHTSAMQEQYNI